MAQDKISLVAVDLDDSLLGPGMDVSLRNREALDACRARGVRVVLATGRMFCSARPIAEELGLVDPVIAYQGALIKTLSGELIEHVPLPLELAREVIERVAPYGYHINVYLDDSLFVASLTEEARRYAAFSGVAVTAVGDLVAFLTADPTKVLVSAPEARLDELIVELAPVLGNRLNMNKSKPYFLEFSHRNAAKGRALAKLAGLWGCLREQILAVGDSENDVDMLEYAGIGVAMGNARPEIKAHADWVTTGNDADGVAQALERFVLGSGEA